MASINQAAVEIAFVPSDGADMRRSAEQLEHANVGNDENTAETLSVNTRPKIFRSVAHEVLFVFIATMSVAMPSFLQGSTLVISSSIKKDLNMSTSELTWMTAASSLTTGSFLLFFGRVSDMFDRRAILLTSLWLFAIFALGTGFSNNAITLDILNAIMGLTCAATIPSAQGILGTIYEKPSKRKNFAFACFTSGNHLGFVFSAIFSGIATHLFKWRASFWLLSLIYVVIAITASFVTPQDDGDKLPFSAFKRFDFAGAALTVGGIGLLTAGISIGPDAPQSWETPYVIVFVIVGVLMIALFVWWESRSEHPLMPTVIWREKEFSLLLAILLLGFLSFPTLFFFAALYLQEIFGFSALITAVCFTPTAVSGIVVNILAGRFLHKVSNKFLMAIGAAAFAVAFLLVAVQRSGVSYWAFTFPALTLVVVGTDLEFNVVNMYVVSSLTKSQQSIASSIFQTTVKFATTVGLGATAAIFASVSEHPAASGYHARDVFEPYAAVSWFSMALSLTSLLLVPFLKIKTQGH